MIYVTSDTHFFDQHLLGRTNFADRPFLDAYDMNEKIIAHWNEVVAPEDTVYHLGDIAVHFVRPESQSHQDVYELLQRLNGNLVLIKGNHDNRALFKYLAKHNYQVNGRDKFRFEDVGALIKYNHRQYYLTHYPMMLGIVPNIINLHGHIHHYSVHTKENINVGVDSADFDYLLEKPKFGQPLNLTIVEQIIMAKRDDFLKMR
ncbi:metallophosphoesterase [Ligilactobacillus equi]